MTTGQIIGSFCLLIAVCDLLVGLVVILPRTPPARRAILALGIFASAAVMLFVAAFLLGWVPMV